MTGLVRRFPDLAALTRAALAEVTGLARDAVARRGRFSLALSGGSTPLSLYAAMAREGIGAPPASILYFFGDERLVPAGDRRSNFGTIAPVLFTPSTIPVGNIHPMPVEVLPASLAAETYETEIRETLSLAPGETPAFDLVLLGMGPDGHTASLFPGSPALGATVQLVAAVPAPETVEPKVPRLTMTLPLVNAARRVLFLVGAKGKEDALARAVEGPPDPAVPASLVRRHEGVTWLVAEA